MEMFNPPHPGEIIREDCLKPLGLTVTVAAKGLGVSRRSLSELLNGRNGISAGMAFAARNGWLEHRGIVAAQSADLRSLAGQTARRPSQSDKISRPRFSPTIPLLRVGCFIERQPLREAQPSTSSFS
jgi:addiction module HigA family antidote